MRAPSDAPVPAAAPADRRVPDDRRGVPAGHVVVALYVGLLLGALLNAEALLATAERQPVGPVRAVAVASVRPLVAVSHVLQLHRPRRALDVALGRVEEVPPSEPADVAPRPEQLAAASPSPTPASTPREITAEEPLRLYVGGDSMVGQFGPMLANVAEKTDLVEAEVQYEFESGLTRPDFIDWPARLDDVADTFRPDAVVLFFGGNDNQPMPQDDGPALQPGTPEWREAYRERVGSVMRQLGERGIRVYWMGMPIVRSEKFRETLLRLNEIYESEASQHEHVTYVDTWSLFSGPGGGYSEFLPDESGSQTDMRLNDGVHLTTAGGLRLARALFPTIAEDFELEVDAAS